MILESFCQFDVFPMAIHQIRADPDVGVSLGGAKTSLVGVISNFQGAAAPLPQNKAESGSILTLDMNLHDFQARSIDFSQPSDDAFDMNRTHSAPPCVWVLITFSAVADKALYTSQRDTDVTFLSILPGRRLSTLKRPSASGTALDSGKSPEQLHSGVEVVRLEQRETFF